VKELFNLDHVSAIEFWQSSLRDYKSAYEKISKIYEPLSSLSLGETSQRFRQSRIGDIVDSGKPRDARWHRDLSFLPQAMFNRCGIYSPLPLCLYVLEHKCATLPSCLDPYKREPLSSSLCISINVNCGGEHIAYIFRRSDSEIQALMFGGILGVLTAVVTVSLDETILHWFGSKTHEPYECHLNTPPIKKLISYLESQATHLSQYIRKNPISIREPLCLVGYYDSVGHYIYNELPTLAILKTLPFPISVATGDFDYCNINYFNSQHKFQALSCMEMHGISPNPNDSYIYFSPRPLVLFKDEFSIGNPDVKKIVIDHLREISNPHGVLSAHLVEAENSLVVILGIRESVRRQFVSFGSFIEMIDNIFAAYALKPLYYLDGLSAPPRSLSSGPLQLDDGLGLQKLINSIPEHIRPRLMDYVIPSLEDKLLIYERGFCGFFQWGSGSMFPTYFSSLPTFCYGHSDYNVVSLEYINNSQRDHIHFLDPTFFEPTNESNPQTDFKISRPVDLNKYLEDRLGKLVKDKLLQP
jgi:hypothetical protein